MKRILFQGDSITDCGRSRDDDSFKGKGYVALLASRMGMDNPGEYEFINRGISGNRITDVYARMYRDIINLKPDYMSILVGVNDVWHQVDRQDGVLVEKYEKIYDMLIGEILEALPNLKIMIIEPFITKGTSTEEQWDAFQTEVPKRAAAAKRIAEKYNLTYLTLQDKFDKMLAIHPEPYWTREGVHPTEAGHELIAREWLKAFESMK